MAGNKNVVLNELIKILSSSKKIDAWKVVDTIINGNELFFVYKNVDMNRSKLVHNISLTVYKDFEEDGKKYRGSSSVAIHPTMESEDLEKAVEDAAFAAGFIKNEYYPIAKPENNNGNVKYTDTQAVNKVLVDEAVAALSRIADGLYSSDINDKGRINASEFFVNNLNVRIVNSEGIDESYDITKGDVEFITSWKETDDEIELYKRIRFNEFDEKYFAEEAKEMLARSRERAAAVPTPALKDIPVLLTGEPVEEFFRYYYEDSSASAVYNQVSTFKVGESVQGDKVEGDLLNIELDPFMKGSADCAPFDEDGVKLSKVKIIEDGVLKKYWGDVRHSYYLGVEPTGTIKNVVVNGGKKTTAELKQEPYLELAAFSDFQMDSLTGDFAGEIRLGWYFDGKETKAVTSGSISGNAKKVQGNFYLSKELQHSCNFTGPKTIKLYGVSVAGK